MRAPIAGYGLMWTWEGFFPSQIVSFEGCWGFFIAWSGENIIENISQRKKIIVHQLKNKKRRKNLQRALNPTH